MCFCMLPPGGYGYPKTNTPFHILFSSLQHGLPWAIAPRGGRQFVTSKLLGSGGHQDSPVQHQPVGSGRRRGGIRSPAPPAAWPQWRDLRLSDAVCCAGVPAGRGAGGGGHGPHQGGAPANTTLGSGPVGPAPFDDDCAAAPPLPR